jgi:anti-anti-sigma factor
MKDYEVKKEGSMLTITLGEELAVANAPALMDELASYKEQGVEKVVFDATNLQYLSSSGVRAILYCKKYLSTSSNIVFVNCNKDVLDVFDLVGIRAYITFEYSSSAT